MDMSRGSCALALLVLLMALSTSCVGHAKAAAHEYPGLVELNTISQSLPVAEVPGESYAYVLPTHHQVLPGISGIKRLLLGSLVMAAAILYFSKVTYPKLTSQPGRAVQDLLRRGLDMMGEDVPNEYEIFFERYASYVEKSPEKALGEIGAFCIGLALFLSGIVALGRPRKVVPVKTRSGFW